MEVLSRGKFWIPNSVVCLDRIAFVRKSALSLLLISLFSIVNCTSSPMPGALFSKTSQHIYGVSSGGSQVRSNRVVRSGKSCSIGSWFLLAYAYYGGGGSVEEAMKDGGISRIAVIDRESLCLFYGLFFQECTVVWGE